MRYDYEKKEYIKPRIRVCMLDEEEPLALSVKFDNNDEGDDDDDFNEVKEHQDLGLWSDRFDTTPAWKDM